MVATDDLAWVRLHLADQPDLVLAQGSPEEDFAVLAACNHSLIGNSHALKFYLIF